ncbi:MFS transporter [Sesbania bispinosa]|nr:MFS transporter [Sesbania bispinosa]
MKRYHHQHRCSGGRASMPMGVGSAIGGRQSEVAGSRSRWTSCWQRWGGVVLFLMVVRGSAQCRNDTFT